MSILTLDEINIRSLEKSFKSMKVHFVLVKDVPNIPKLKEPYLLVQNQ